MISKKQPIIIGGIAAQVGINQFGATTGGRIRRSVRVFSEAIVAVSTYIAFSPLADLNSVKTLEFGGSITAWIDFASRKTLRD